MFRHLWLVSFLLLFLALPVLAQTEEPTATVDVIAATEASSEATAIPASIQITINQQAPPPAITSEPAPLGGANGLFILIGFAILATAGIVIGLFHKQNLDKVVTVQVSAARNNDQLIAELRAARENSSDQAKMMFDLVKNGVTAIAPLTGIKADDEIAALLDDISDSTAVKQALLQVKARKAVETADAATSVDTEGGLGVP